MEFELPPDPYAALGVSKAATSADIKKAWQKLVLKCHPDKVSDEAAKLKANDEFHRVQSAYELIGDDASRERYNAQVRIHELRKQNERLRSGGHAPRFDVRTAAYGVPTGAPPQASYTTRGPPRYHAEERRPSYYNDDEPPRGTARKYTAATEYTYVKRSAPPKERERERERERARASTAEERKKAERKRDVEEKESRARKFETRQEEFHQFEEERRRRDREEAERRKASEASRPTLRRDDTFEQTRIKEEEARRYMQAHERPEFYRTTSRDIPQYTYVRRSAGEAKDNRRGREAESPRGSPPRGTASARRSREDVEPFDSRPSTLKQQTSAPPKTTSSTRDPPPPHRSYTTPTDYDHRKGENEPPFSLPRANTMPTVLGTSTRKPQPAQPSKLRTSDSAMNPDSGYSSPATPDKQYATSSYPPPPPPPVQPSMTRATTYVYPSGNTTSGSAGGYEYSNGHRVLVREPPAANSSARRRSSSPIGERDRDVRMSSTAAKMAHLASGSPRTRSSPFPAYPDSPASRPPMAQTSSTREVPRSSRSPESRDRRRDRDRYRDDRPREKLYGEMGPGLYRGQPTSYRPEQISFSKRYGPDDVIYSSRARGSQERVYDERRPSLGRSSTAVY